jgi:ABC-type multidrug transport system permease subunit
MPAELNAHFNDDATVYGAEASSPSSYIKEIYYPLCLRLWSGGIIITITIIIIIIIFIYLGFCFFLLGKKKIFFPPT